MLSARGYCSKCRQELNLISPGLKCSRCRKYFHGSCMVPPMNVKAMENYALKYKDWYCDSCKKMVEDENTKRTDSEIIEIKKNLDVVKEIREILVLIEDALITMSDKCEKLTNSAVATKNENLELRRRIKLHERLGRKVPKNYDEWRKQRKEIEVKDSHKKKRLKTYKKDVESKEAFKKVKNLSSYVRKVHKWKKKPKPRKVSSGEPQGNTCKKRMNIFKQKLAFWTQAHTTNLSEGWLIQVFILILLIIYTFIGALIFWIVEGRYEQQLVDEILETRENVLKNSLNGNASDLLGQYYDYLAEKFGNNSKLLIRKDDELNWSFFGSMYFCGTTYTTIGYGDITPITKTGKILTIIYALFGIPLFLTLLALLGKNFTNMLRSCSKCCKKKESPTFDNDDDEEEKLIFPLWALILIDLIYLTLGALMFLFSEGWNYLNAVYFVVITILTIGFGDYVMATHTFMIICVAYVIIGLALTSMIIALILEKLKNKFNLASKKLGEAADSYFVNEENEK